MKFNGKIKNSGEKSACKYLVKHDEAYFYKLKRFIYLLPLNYASEFPVALLRGK
jgi:hypothetical protein